MRVVWLTLVVIGGILMGSLQGQAPHMSMQECQALLVEKNKEVLQEKLTFYRLHMDAGKGDWHLFNEEDARWLKTVQEKIDSGDYQHTKIEWTTRVVERLPE